MSAGAKMPRLKPDYARPLDIKRGRVDMAHGAGGRAMAQLIRELFAAQLGNEYLDQGDDGARLPPARGRIVMSTDCHVVSPLFFPGGDIGCLSVHGTINDVAMMGAQPLYLAAGFILEEGFPLAQLQRIIASMALASRQARRSSAALSRGKKRRSYVCSSRVRAKPRCAIVSRSWPS